MGPRNTQYPLVPQQGICQPLRSGDVGEAAVEDFLHQRIAARYHIADHEHIRVERQLFHAKAFDQLDALRFQLRAHRRVYVGIAACYPVTRLLGECRDAAHEDAADSQDMYSRGFIRAHRYLVLRAYPHGMQGGF